MAWPEWKGRTAVVSTRLEPLVARTIGALGLELADLEISNRGKLLRIFIDRPLPPGQVRHAIVGPSGESVTLADCEAATRQLQRVFEVEGVVYDRLEVSSPGLDRKLKKASDFERFSGQPVDIRLRRLVNGRRHVVGTLQGLAGTEVEVQMAEGPFRFDLADLERARLVPKL